VSGLTATGFDIRRLETIVLAIRGRLSASLGANINTGADSVFGQIIGAVAPSLALIWEGFGSLYQALNPDQAVGDQLDNIARLNGLTRLGPTRATGTITIAATNGAVIPIGSRALNPTTQVTVETTEQVTVGVSGVASIAVRAVEAGVVVSAINGITQIVTPVAGWSAISSSSALTSGRFREDDADLRTRIAQSSNVVASVDGAIRTALLAITSVESALVISNRGLTPDGIGTPGKSVRIVIAPDLSTQADVEAEIANALFSRQPAGIQTVGIGANSRTATVIDQQGFVQTVQWEYPTLVPVEYVTTLLVDLSIGPLTSAEAETLALEALQAFTDGLGVGVDVTPVDVQCALRDAVPGLLAVTSLTINGSTGVIAIAFNEFASFDVDTTVAITPA
jgi:hypothetical protein